MLSGNLLFHFRLQEHFQTPPLFPAFLRGYNSNFRKWCAHRYGFSDFIDIQSAVNKRGNVGLSNLVETLCHDVTLLTVFQYLIFDRKCYQTLSIIQKKKAFVMPAVHLVGYFHRLNNLERLRNQWNLTHAGIGLCTVDNGPFHQPDML